MIRIFLYKVNKVRKILSYILVIFLLVGFDKEVKGAIILSPSFSFSENYNDNLFFTEKDRKSDFVTVLSPVLGLALSSKYATLSINYIGSAQFHSKHPEADGYFQDISFDIDFPILNHQIRGLEMSVIEKASYTPGLPAFSFGGDEEDTEERFNQIFLEGEGVQQSGRVDTFRNRAGISLRYPFWKHFSLDASYLNVVTRYSGGTLDDSVVHVVGFGGNVTKSFHWLSKKTEWTTSYGSSLSISEEDRDWIHRFNFGTQYLISRLVTARGSLGVGLPEGESAEIVSGVGISKRYKTGSVELRYTNEIVTGLGVIQEPTHRQSVVGLATRGLGQRISSSIQIGYVSSQSFEGDEVSVSAYTAGSNLSISLLSWLSGEFNYTYLKQQSRGNLGEGFEKNLVIFTLTAVGPSWRMIK